ncbi:MAG TPA: sulfatase-like hydrolase/transferase [Chitinophagales bacterium]|nr:sulfatase-like hydrolase/transferase [Chitinophagales bacterium]
MNPPRHIVVIIADSLRHDAVYRNNTTLLPYFEQKAIQYTQARSSGCWTLPATASLFTGLMPHQHGATSQTRYVRTDVPTLAERLKAIGYHTYQVTANVATTDVFGLHRGFDEIRKIWKIVPAHFNRLQQFLLLISKPRLRRMIFSKDLIAQKLSEDIEMQKTWLQLTHEDVFNEARKIIAQHDAKNEKCFIFLNLMESHFPYHVGATLEMSADGMVNRLRESSALFNTINQTFLTTGKLGIKPEMLKVLRERQRKSWEIIAPAINRFTEEVHRNQENMVVFGSDHGDNFGDQGWLYHFSNVTDGGNKVPLMILPPDDNLQPQSLAMPVNTKDLYATILDSCGIGAGASLLKYPEESVSVLQSYWYNNKGKTLPQYKYNQICFVEGEHRYVYRSTNWLWAPISKDGGREPEFEPLVPQANPIYDAVKNPERRKKLNAIFNDFKTFAEKIGTGN